MGEGGRGHLDQPASGVGVASYDSKRRLLDAWFPQPALGTRTPADPSQLPPTGTDAIREVYTETIRVSIASLAEPPADTADVWLRLHLLSHRLIKPHDANLDGIFGLLTNVAWTSLGPVAAEDVEPTRLRARITGLRLEVYGVDKFPR